MTTHLIISAALLCAIVGFESWRRIQGQPFGLLSVANMVFTLNYCVSPMLLAFAPGTDFATGPYGRPLFMLQVVESLELTESSYLNASMLSVLAYGGMIGTYLGVSRFTKPTPLQVDGIPLRWLISTGLILGSVAIVALLIYSSQFPAMFIGTHSPYHSELYQYDPTGIYKMMKLGNIIRGNVREVSWGFLQIIIMLGVPALIMLSAAGLRVAGRQRVILIALAVVVWMVVFARTYHAAGRMELAISVALIPLAIVLSMRNQRQAFLGVVALFVFGMFVGLAKHSFFGQPLDTAMIMLDAQVIQFGRSALYMANEFAFPFPIVAHTLETGAESIGYRYFVDIPLAMLYMLPSLGGVDTWPEMISHIHERLVPLMLPYDLVSFGYYSLGWGGIAIVFAAMGGLLAVFDKWLTPGTGWLVQCLRASWMMYLPFRIMYADPYTSMKTGFGLIVGTFLILGMAWLSKRRAKLA